MRITRIQLKVKNATNTPKVVNLLQPFALEPDKAANQPGVLVKVIITTTGSRYYQDYADLVNNLQFKPLVIAVKHTTSNRQLNFLYQQPDLGKKHIPPGVDKTGNRLTDFDKWNPDQWNIADSGCSAIYDSTTIIECKLLPLQEFNIFLAVKSQPKIEIPNPAPGDTKKIVQILHHFLSPNETTFAQPKKPCICKRAFAYSKFTDCDGNCQH